MPQGLHMYRDLLLRLRVHKFCTLRKHILPRNFCQVRWLSSEIDSDDNDDAVEVLKVGFSIARAQGSSAISDKQKTCSYGELLRSSFQVSTLLQNLHTRDLLPVVNICNEEDLGRRAERWEEGSERLGVYKKTDVEGNVVVVTERSKAIATTLKGARVGIMGKPSAEFVAGMWGTWLSGAIAVPLALDHPEAELLHVLVDAGISSVLATDEHRGLLEPAARKCGARFGLLSSVPSLQGSLQECKEDDRTPIEQVVADARKISSSIHGDQDALIIYTSGTTGKPKGVVHTHASIGAQVRMLAEAWKYSPADRFLHCLPLHHVHGLVNILLAPIFVGASVEFLPKFSTFEVWQRWRESYPSQAETANDAITVFSGVPTIYVRLLQGYDLMNEEDQKEYSLAATKLRLMMCGSSALPQPVMEKWEKITGHRLLERYGMTEFGMALSNPLSGERRPGFVGEPLPGVEVLIEEDEESGEGIGNLCIKSPGMFHEYWRLPQITIRSFRGDGFFETGDTATRENGYYKILGRTSVDIIKSGAIKSRLLKLKLFCSRYPDHPVIAECAVLGIPDKDYGELVTAIIVPHESKATLAAAKWEPVLTLQALREWAGPLLAPYKIPQHLIVWETLPRNPMGKVNKKNLQTFILEGTMKI